MKKKVILVTGRIGAGKSEVLAYLNKTFGIPVFNCDIEAKRLYENKDILAEVSNIVGGGIITKDGELDKKALATVIFSDPEKLKKVEKIIHAKVRENFELWKQSQFSPIVAMESAIALKKGRDVFDYVVVVEASEETRLKRAMLRDDATEDEIRQRMRNQSFDISNIKVDAHIDNEVDFKPAINTFIQQLYSLNIAVFAGSFDPFTNGHLAVLKKACTIFDKVYVGIARNPNKSRNYSISKMKEAILETIETEGIRNCVVSTYSGLTARFCQAVGAIYLVRGLRNDEDFFYEEKIAKTNRYLAPEIETIYFRADNDIISSSTVRGFFKEGEDISRLVPQPVKNLMFSY